MSIYNYYNLNLTKEPLFPETVQSSNSFTSGAAANSLTSGELTGNLVMADGYMQSGNFVTGSAGWKIDKDGNVEFCTGTFRGTLAAVSGTFGALTVGTSGSIALGKTGYTDDTNAGFWLGDVSGTGKFNIGLSSTKYFHYDGTDLTIAGGTITGGTIQTAATGYRVRLNGSTSKLEVLTDNTVLSSLYASASGDLILDSTDDVLLALGGAVKCGAHSTAFKPDGDGTYNLGASDKRWNFGYFKDLKATNGYTGDVYVATSDGGSPTKKLDIEDGIVYDR